MNLEEMNIMDPVKIPYSALTLALTNAVARLTAQIAEASEHLKRLAYPMQVVGKDGSVVDYTPTLRDQFAMAAMKAQVSLPTSVFWQEKDYEEVCKRSYMMADAMLEARKK